MVIQANSHLAETFREYFGAIEDPRVRDGDHDLFDVLFLSVCATIAGADGPSDIEDFGHDQLSWLRKFIRLRNGVPSHDTIGRLLSLIKPMEFQEAFLGWIASFKMVTQEDDQLTLIPIDGKTLRNSGTDSNKPLHLVSAWATEHGLSLGQVAVDQKSNEITAIPKLLQMLELRGSLVTIDAMGCQKEIAKQIVQDGGDYCLAVKENQPKLHDAIATFFDDAGENDFSKNDCDCWATDEVSRGRTEHRGYVVSPVTDEMSKTFKGWKGLESIGRTISMVERDGKETVETRYYILSNALSAKQFGRAVRCHWGIESMHWILDVTFNEDASQITKGHGPENFGFLRRFVISLLKRDTSKGSLRLKRKRAGWNTDFLEQVLKNI